MFLNPKTPLVVGIVATAALAGYLLVHHPLPDALSRAHAQVLPGTDIHSCRQCHADEGLTAGCLACHTDIAGQLDAEQGYHAFLAEGQVLNCAPCHPEHHGEAFPLVSALSWPGGDPSAFDHPHCTYELAGSHDDLACMECHENKLTQVFALPDFPGCPRASTFFGLKQDCLACHVDVHAWPAEKACLNCHDQTAFDPASVFQHNDVFVLEGVHADTDCAGCHVIPDSGGGEAAVTDRMPGSLPFHNVTGETCTACHPSPHRTVWDAECQSCHFGRDTEWQEGTRGLDVKAHRPTGFPLTGGHVTVSCGECHPTEQDYAQRYPDPKAEGYQRQPNTCQGCHEDVHAGMLDHNCATCHQVSGWEDGHLLFDHDRDTTFALDAVHKGLSCQACHAVDDMTYRAEGTECAACHEVQAKAFRGQARRLQIDPDPHFDRVACIDCHDMNDSRQSMDRYAQRCADCHNDQYASLAFQWAQSLQRRQAAVEHLMGSQGDTSSEAIGADLSEAMQSGFHHLHLTQQLYDRLLETLQSGEGETPMSREEDASWTGR